MLRCETERLRSIKNLIESKLGKEDLLKMTADWDETVSLISGTTVRSNMSSLRRATNRFSTFLRNARTKKPSVVLEEEVVCSKGTNLVSKTSPACNHSSKWVTQDLMNTGEPKLSAEASINMASLLQQEWFHGVLPREDVVRLLSLYVKF